MVEVTDLYGVTRNYDRKDARDVQAQVDRDKLYLEAAQTGDYSKIVSKGASGQERSEVESRAKNILRQYTAVKGQQTNDYSAAASGTPVLYPGHSFERVFGEGKGYAVYDSFKTDDGSQYLAVSGKNSSWVEKVNPDGTRERVMSTRGNDDDGRASNINYAKRALADVKESLSTTTTTDTGSDAKSAITKLIASYDHFVATGEDDGGGFINAETGLPIGANNEAEAFLMRSGNYVMSQDTMLGILDNSSDAVKQALAKNYTVFDTMGGDMWSQVRDRVASDLLTNVMGGITDNRDFGKLLAVSAYSADAFINAVGVANTQNYSVGDPTWNEETGEFQGYNRGNVTFGIVNGQPMMTGVTGATTALNAASLNSLWVSPEDVQGIVQGDVYANYQDYYDKFRKEYEFLNDFDFLNLKGLDNKIIKKPTDTSGLTVTPGMTGSGYTAGTSDYTDTSGLTFQTSAAAPVTYDPQQVTQTFQTAQPQLGGAGTGTYPQAAVTGTFNTPTQTANLSAVPQTITTKTDYTGTNMANLTQPSQGVGGVQQVTYANPNTGQQLRMTEINGSPIGVIPPGFQKVTAAARGGYINGYSEGGDVELEGKYRIYKKQFGYNGPKTREAIEQFEEARPEVKRKGMAIGGYVRKFNRGGVVRGFDEGGLTKEQLANMQASAVTQTMQPLQSNVQMLVPDQADFIAPTAGQTYAIAPFAQAATVPSTAQAGMPMTSPAATMTAGAVTPQVQAETAAMQPVTGTVSPEAQVTAAQQATTSVTGMEAAQGTAIMMDNPVQREIQEGELISGAANAEKASQYAEEIQAATATPTKQATVAGQLEGLMQQFEGGETPAWAAGSIRTAMQTLAARGLGASSLAGQAVIQAAMEAALPIAQMDAQTQAQFEAQNLSNRQQRAMLAAQQRATFLGQEFDQEFQARVANASRIADVANINFNAEQQVALENSRAANTMNLTNLNNSQAMVMAEAAALSQLDMANLNNRQQAAVQNAQNFLQMDMQNLSNEQQTAMFKAQQNIQAMFTDQAAENAAAQFNATSENQTNQFFASLTSQVSQFNASQQNAMDQFNVNSVNALREFNSELQQQRDLFNAQNGLVIAQSNAQWRQNIATMNTAALNESNADYAKTINGLTAANMDQIWQRERDIMSFAFASAESAADRAANIAIAKLTADEQSKLQDSIGKGKLAAIALDAVLGKWL